MLGSYHVWGMAEAGTMTTQDVRAHGHAARTKDELRELWCHTVSQGAPDGPAEAVIRELSEYFEMPIETVRDRCEHSKDFSREEWLDSDRTTQADFVEFWNRISPVFGITMSHARQCTGEHPASSVDIASVLADLPPGDLLDFGAGPGTNAMFFTALGWRVTMAEVSSTMLEVAQWRFRRRGLSPTTIDTTQEKLPANSFDVALALEVMAHIPDIPGVLAEIRTSLRPGGYFVFNVFAPPRSADTLSHLYVGNWHVIRHVRRAGFRRHPRIGYFYMYERVEQSTMRRAFITVVDNLRHNPVVAAIGRVARRGRTIVGALRDRPDRPD
jgi:2-polyprenyl-3-methyl-5-hydroxy-6-metoxy-1,4-benzoquinol methylase